MKRRYFFVCASLLACICIVLRMLVVEVEAKAVKEYVNTGAYYEVEVPKYAKQQAKLRVVSGGDISDSLMLLTYAEENGDVEGTADMSLLNNDSEFKKTATYGLFEGNECIYTWQELIDSTMLLVKDGELFANKSYSSSLKGKLVIDDKILSIGERAFYGCNELTEIEMTNVVNIGDYAFSECRALNSISLSDSIVHIGKYVCAKSTSLEKVEFPDNLSMIPEGMFEECDALKSVTVPESVTRIDDGAFNNCMSLEEVTMSEGVCYIGESVFSGCVSLRKVDLPRSLMCIGENAFKRCCSIKELKVYDTVSVLGEDTFLDVGSVKYISRKK